MYMFNATCCQPVSTGPEGAQEPMVVQESGNRQETAPAQTSDATKGNKNDNSDEDSSIPAVPPPKRWWSVHRKCYTSALITVAGLLFIFCVCIYLFLLCRPTSNKNIAAHERITIYFHAVLSKDFKFNPKDDSIFIQAGSHIGKWHENIVELFSTRYIFLEQKSQLLKFSQFTQFSVTISKN